MSRLSAGEISEINEYSKDDAGGVRLAEKEGI